LERGGKSSASGKSQGKKGGLFYRNVGGLTNSFWEERRKSGKEEGVYIDQVEGAGGDMVRGSLT